MSYIYNSIKLQCDRFTKGSYCGPGNEISTLLYTFFSFKIQIVRKWSVVKHDNVLKNHSKSTLQAIFSRNISFVCFTQVIVNIKIRRGHRLLHSGQTLLKLCNSWRVFMTLFFILAHLVCYCVIKLITQ